MTTVENIMAKAAMMTQKIIKRQNSILAPIYQLDIAGVCSASVQIAWSFGEDRHYA
jgi:hypothetical protein